MLRINHIALKVTDLEGATKFYENVYGFRQVKTGRSRGHISRHMTDGYVDLALMIYDSEDDAEAMMGRSRTGDSPLWCRGRGPRRVCRESRRQWRHDPLEAWRNPDQISLAGRHRRGDRAHGAI